MGVKQKAYSQQNILDDSKFKIYPLSFKFNVKIYVFQINASVCKAFFRIKPPHLNKSKYC